MSTSLRMLPRHVLITRSSSLAAKGYVSTPLPRISRTAQSMIPPTHHAFLSQRTYATAEDAPTSSPDVESAPRPRIYRDGPTQSILQLLSGAVFIFVGYALANILSRPTYNPTLKPSLIGKANLLANPPRYGTKTDYERAIAELQALWKKKGKEDRVSVDESDLESHGISDWSYHEERRPTVVVWAENTREVQEIVVLAIKYKVPITPFSGGTSLEGHFSSVSQVISLELW